MPHCPRNSNGMVCGAAEALCWTWEHPAKSRADTKLATPSVSNGRNFCVFERMPLMLAGRCGLIFADAPHDGLLHAINALRAAFIEFDEAKLGAVRRRT